MLGFIIIALGIALVISGHVTAGCILVGVIVAFSFLADVVSG